MTGIDDRIGQAWHTGGLLALNRTAELLAAEGTDETTILAGLERLMLAERAAGVSEEREDQITDVMDRLSGWCHESAHIHTARPAASGPAPVVAAAAHPAPRPTGTAG